MRLNSNESIETGRRLIRAYGNWAEVMRHAVRQPDGRLSVRLADAPARDGALNGRTDPR